MSAYLSRDELREWTGGYTRKTIIRCLDDGGHPYTLGVDGWPRVLRAYHDRVMMGGQAPQSPPSEPILHL